MSEDWYRSSVGSLKGLVQHFGEHATSLSSREFSSAMVTWHQTGKLASPVVYLDAETPNTEITGVDGNVQ